MNKDLAIRFGVIYVVSEMAKLTFREAAKMVSRRATRGRIKQLKSMSKEERSEMMRKVARARWANKKKLEADTSTSVGLEGIGRTEVATQGS